MSDQTASNNHISIQTRLDRNLLLQKGSSCIVWITVKAPHVVTHGHRAPLNLALVLDRSGSMSGHKLEYVKRAATHALKLLDQRDRVAVIIYDDEVEVLAPSQAVDDKARSEMTRLIAPIVTGGSTNMGGGWLSGCEQVAGAQDPEATNRALLLTDGLANVGIVDREELARHAKQLKVRGITTTTLGVGADFDEHMLKAISDAGGGHFYFIEKPGDIPAYFEFELGEMLTMVARSMVLSIQIPMGAQVDLLNEYEYSVRDGVLNIPLGEIASSQSIDLVLRLSLPAAKLGSTFTLQTKLSYQLASAQQNAQVDGDPIVLTTVSQQQYQQQTVDVSVADRAVELEVARAQNEAMKLDHDGHPEQAAQVLCSLSGTISLAYEGIPSSLSAKDELERFNQEITEKTMSPVQLKQQMNANYQRRQSRSNPK
ncbi:MAG: vWA domain-containing protein [Anaerolineae bacterium]